MSLLPSIVSNSTRPAQPLLLLQSSVAQSALPILRDLIAKSRGNVLLICYLYPHTVFSAGHDQHNVDVIDCTEYVLGYHSKETPWKARVLSSLQGLDPTQPVTVVIDSIETLLSNVSGSISAAHTFLSEIFSSVQKHKGHSRLVVHGIGSSPLTSSLRQPSFSSTLTHIIAHPPVLIEHLARSYSTPPPPLSTPEKFWGVFLPIAEREAESEALVFGADGEGYGGSEIVVELVVRSTGDGRRRGVERALEGWIVEGDVPGPCDLRKLDSLRSIWSQRGAVQETGPDPTKNASFNLNLTPEQQQSRAQVPLPYAHDAAPGTSVIPEGSILYDPDSADDMDDDDPDEDLDI
ncbi:hypothetical protein BDW22DRAFT_1350132 [Trametopsis cervina]|nr:hypothetical protein BDW22DRAFT_1350132 [Trametopsis cervina]